MTRTSAVYAETRRRARGRRIATLLACAAAACARSSASEARAGQGAAPAAPSAPGSPATSAPAAKAAPAEPAPQRRAAPSAELKAQSPCSAICARSVALSCEHAAECESVCAAGMADGTCGAEIKAATDCMLREPASHWECSDGLAAIKDGFCDAEQARAATCMAAAVGPQP